MSCNPNYETQRNSVQPPRTEKLVKNWPSRRIFSAVFATLILGVSTLFARLVVYCQTEPPVRLMSLTSISDNHSNHVISHV